MWIEEYARNLQLLAIQHVGDYLETGSKELLMEQARQLRDSAKRRREKSLIKWEFTILREHPLMFKTDDHKLKADVAGIVKGMGDIIEEVNTLLRIWCLDEKVYYREGIDGEEVKRKLAVSGKRVLVRFHFDRRAANARRPEPLYHLQVGGKSLDDECCWFPEDIDVPRFHFPPMDIVLLCELVLVNFFHKQSEELRKKPEWRSLVRKSQEIFQSDYFDKCSLHLRNQTDTLLGHLMSIS